MRGCKTASKGLLPCTTAGSWPSRDSLPSTNEEEEEEDDEEEEEEDEEEEEEDEEEEEVLL